MAQPFYPFKNEPARWFMFFFLFFIMAGSIATYLSLNSETAAGKLKKPLLFLHQYQVPAGWTLDVSDFVKIEAIHRTGLIPAENAEGKFEGMVVQGNAVISFTWPGQSTVTYPVTQAYLPVNQRAWDVIIADLNENKTMPTKAQQYKAQKLTNDRESLFFSYSFLGYTRLYPGTASPKILFTTAPNEELYRYVETDSATVEKIGQGIIHKAYLGEPSLSPLFATVTNGKTTTETSIWLVLLFLVSVLTLCFILTWILTAHLNYQPGPILMLSKKTPSTAYSILLIVLYIAISLWDIDYTSLHAKAVGACLLLLVIPYIRTTMEIREFGLGLRNLPVSVLIASLLAFSLQLISALNIPLSLQHHSAAVRDFIQTFIFIALLHEVFWRGLIQNGLEKMVGQRYSAILVILGLIMFAMLPAYGLKTFYDFNEMAITYLLINPIWFFISTFFYYKVRNLWASALLYTLIIWLPKWLVF